METVDFPRSFLTFRIDLLKKPPKTVSHKPPYTLNNARIPLDCCLTISEKDAPFSVEFVLGVNCKTERVGVDRDIWTEPNADFVPICSRDTFMALKAFDVADKGVMLYPPSLGKQPERQIISVEETFDSLRIDIARTPGRVLDTPAEIVEAVLARRILNARTTLENDRYRAVIEYPVKTVNANERDQIYQPDTGPVLLPDLTRLPDDLIGGLELAFAAFNTPAWVEFIVRTPVEAAAGVRVYHYAKPLRMDARNEVILVE
jgi:hypothetical protein